MLDSKVSSGPPTRNKAGARKYEIKLPVFYTVRYLPPSTCQNGPLSRLPNSSVRNVCWNAFGLCGIKLSPSHVKTGDFTGSLQSKHRAMGTSFSKFNKGKLIKTLFNYSIKNVFLIVLQFFLNVYFKSYLLVFFQILLLTVSKIFNYVTYMLVTNWQSYIKKRESGRSFLFQFWYPVETLDKEAKELPSLRWDTEGSSGVVDVQRMNVVQVDCSINVGECWSAQVIRRIWKPVSNIRQFIETYWCW